MLVHPRQPNITKRWDCEVRVRVLQMQFWSVFPRLLVFCHRGWSRKLATEAEVWWDTHTYTRGSNRILLPWTKSVVAKKNLSRYGWLMNRICSRKSDESFVAGVRSDRSEEVASGVRDKLLREWETGRCRYQWSVGVEDVKNGLWWSCKVHWTSSMQPICKT